MTVPGIARDASLLKTGGDERFIVQELVRGPTLAYVGQGSQAFTFGTLASWVKDVAEAVAAAHTRGVPHLDLCPDRVFVGAQGTRVTGFAMPARSAALRLSSPAHVAPELLGERRISRAADVYALAAMIYELLTGYPPYSGSDADAVIAAQSTEVPDFGVAAPCGIDAEILRWGQGPLMAALASDPSRRPGLQELVGWLPARSSQRFDAAGKVAPSEPIAMDRALTTKAHSRSDSTVRTIPNSPVTLVRNERLGDLQATNARAAEGLQQAAKLNVEADLESSEDDARFKRTHATFAATQALEHTLQQRLVGWRKNNHNDASAWATDRLPSPHPKQCDHGLQLLRMFLERGRLPSLEGMAGWLREERRIAPPDVADELQAVLGVPDGLEEHAFRCGRARNVLAHYHAYEHEVDELDRASVGLGPTVGIRHRVAGARTVVEVTPEGARFVEWISASVMERAVRAPPSMLDAELRDLDASASSKPSDPPSSWQLARWEIDWARGATREASHLAESAFQTLCGGLSDGRWVDASAGARRLAELFAESAPEVSARLAREAAELEAWSARLPAAQGADGNAWSARAARTAVAAIEQTLVRRLHPRARHDLARRIPPQEQGDLPVSMDLVLRGIVGPSLSLVSLCLGGGNRSHVPAAVQELVSTLGIPSGLEVAIQDASGGAVKSLNWLRWLHLSLRDSINYKQPPVRD